MAKYEVKKDLGRVLRKYYFISAQMRSSADERLEIYEKINQIN